MQIKEVLTKKDSLRWLRVNEDLLRLNSKLGYKAFKNFYYTAEWDFQTSLFNQKYFIIIHQKSQAKLKFLK